jgi:CubicO group peptidase (beta-lactamase class C family)
MKKITKWISSILAVIILIVACASIFFIVKIAPIGSAYKAKRICSCVFLAGRNPDQVIREDVAGLGYIGFDIDKEAKSVTGNFLGLAKRTAIYREGLGCTLVLGRSSDDLKKQALGYKPEPAQDRSKIPWPDGDLIPDEPLPANIDKPLLDKTLEWAFSPGSRKSPMMARAVVVVYEGRIIAERYAEGFDRNTPQLGWSMSKSATNALAGILVKEGKLSLKGPAPVAEWQKPGDPRSAITLDELMRMSSGLKFGEDYVWPLSDAIQMLFNSECAGCYASSKPLETQPDTKWYYSSGTTNIISRLIRQAAGGTDAYFFAFPKKALFDKLGMQSAVIEPGPDGIFVGSSFMYATPRDWARLGLLYLNDGVLKGERILPEGWVKYSTTPTPMAPKGEYGAQIWLNAGPLNNPGERVMPDVPSDMFSFEGFEGQQVAVIPSHKLVVVRMGITWDPDSWDYSQMDFFLSGIVKAVPGTASQKG